LNEDVIVQSKQIKPKAAAKPKEKKEDQAFRDCEFYRIVLMFWVKTRKK
jgi:hypothetical protein